MPLPRLWRAESIDQCHGSSPARRDASPSSSRPCHSNQDT
jgi:hypothetical protein